MTSRFFSLSLAAVCALAITSTALAQQGFRVAAEQLEQHRLTLPAESQQDFGQWQWLTGDKRLAAALAEAGIAFEHFPKTGRIQVHQHRFDPLQYYPHNAYLVWGEQQALNALAQRGNVRFAGEFAADWRVHQRLRSFTGTIRNINLHVFNSGDVRDLLRRVEATGAQVLDAWSAQPDGRFWDIKITLDATRLDSLMGLPELISANFMSPEVFFDDESGAQVVAGNLN